jgi:hypothetical protein
MESGKVDTELVHPKHISSQREECDIPGIPTSVIRLTDHGVWVSLIARVS